MRSTLTLFAAVLVTLAVTPAAHARWITGNGIPPIFSDQGACRNGMSWSYATVFPGSWLPTAPATHTLAFHSIVVDTPSPVTVAFAPSRAVPKDTLTLSPTLNLVAPSHFAPGRFNRFDYSGTFRIPFQWTLLPGTPLKMTWREPNGAWVTGRYQVQNCWLLEPLVLPSGLE